MSLILEMESRKRTPRKRNRRCDSMECTETPLRKGTSTPKRDIIGPMQSPSPKRKDGKSKTNLNNKGSPKTPKRKRSGTPETGDARKNGRAKNIKPPLKNLDKEGHISTTVRQGKERSDTSFKRGNGLKKTAEKLHKITQAHVKVMVIPTWKNGAIHQYTSPTFPDAATPTANVSTGTPTLSLQDQVIRIE